MKLPEALVKILASLGIKINWKNVTIIGKNVYIIQKGETSKVLHSANLPLVGDEEVIQGYVRKDLREIEASYLTLPERFKKLLRDMKDYLPLEYYSALAQAFNVKRFEEEGKIRTADRILDYLRQRWVEGSKIYNLVESGFFEALIYPRFQSICKKHGKNIDAARGEFCKFFDKSLRYFKYAVWVTGKVSPKYIKEQIKVRRKSIRVVTVLARGGRNIGTLDKAVDSLIQEDPKENMKYEILRTIRGKRAKNTIVGDPEIIQSIEKLVKKS